MIESFTVSHSFDTNVPGRGNHFLSVNFRLPNPVTMEEFVLIHAEAAKYVSTCLIGSALVRGMIEPEDAKERMKIMKMNLDQYKTAVEAKNRVNS